jgi:hypothetical protein
MPGFLDRLDTQRQAAINAAVEAENRTKQAEQQEEAQDALRREAMTRDDQTREVAKGLYLATPFPVLLDRLHELTGTESTTTDYSPFSYEYTARKYRKYRDVYQPEWLSVSELSHMAMFEWPISEKDMSIADIILKKIKDRQDPDWRYHKQNGFYLETRADGRIIGHGEITMPTTFDLIVHNPGLAEDILEALYRNPKVTWESRYSGPPSSPPSHQ